MRKHQAGTTLFEAMVAVTFVALFAWGTFGVVQMARSGSKRAGTILNRAQILDYLSGLVINKDCWKRSAAADATLLLHLTSGSPTAVSAETPLALRDENNAVVVAAGGSYLSDNAVQIPQAQAAWFAQATWEGVSQNSARVRITVTPVSKGDLAGVGPKTVSILQSDLNPRCQPVTARVRAGSNPRGPNSQVGSPYRYDSAVVSCPVGTIRTSVTIQPGCGALTFRAQSDPDLDQNGYCHQLSASHPAQITQTGCAASGSGGSRDVDGTCTVICCRFD